MTKEEFLATHPDVVLTPAPITGGADVQLSDYMDAMSTSLNTGGGFDAAVFSYQCNILYVKLNEDELTLKVLHGTHSNGTPTSMKEVVQKLLEYKNVWDVADEFEDYSQQNLFNMDGNVFYPDYAEYPSNTDNSGRIRCLMVNDESAIGANLKRIQKYLEQGNEETDGSIITTYQDGNDVVLQFWYKEKKTNI